MKNTRTLCDRRGCTAGEEGNSQTFAPLTIKGEQAHIFKALHRIDLCPEHLEEFKRFFKPEFFSMEQK